MKKFKHFYSKNAMLIANGMANLIGVLLTQIFFMTGSPGTLPDDIVSIIDRINAIFSPSAFICVTIVTLIYERPIRRFLNCKYQKIEVPDELQIKACRRVINEPFVMIALDFSMWLISAFLFSTVDWALDLDPILIQRTFFMSLSTGLITVIIAFFTKKTGPTFFS